jgi:cytochrome c
LLEAGLALATKKEMSMRHRAVFCSAAAAIFAFAANFSCLAAETPDAAEAKALLDKAVAYFESNGAARAFCSFNDANGAFHKGPLYVFAINMDGVYFAHSAASSLVGTSLRDTRDAAGQPIGKLIMDAVAAQEGGPVEYMWLNYETNKVEKKHTFLKRVENFVLGVGYYTR